MLLVALYLPIFKTYMYMSRGNYIFNLFFFFFCINIYEKKTVLLVTKKFKHIIKYKSVNNLGGDINQSKTSL